MEYDDCGAVVPHRALQLVLLAQGLFVGAAVISVPVVGDAVMGATAVGTAVVVNVVAATGVATTVDGAAV